MKASLKAVKTVHNSNLAHMMVEMTALLMGSHLAYPTESCLVESTAETKWMESNLVHSTDW